MARRLNNYEDVDLPLAGGPGPSELSRIDPGMLLS
jgi:hypothetical protein